MSTRHAVVTGGARGIGAAVVDRLHAQGCTVVVVDSEPWDDDGSDPRRIPLVLDVRAPEAGTQLAEVVAGRLDGRLDVLVNNAGVGHDEPFYAMTDEAFARVLDIDLTGPFRVTRACWPSLVRARGAVVNVSSIHGSRPLPGGAAYAAAKGGLENLTRAMALDAAPHGVRVNAVAPGFVETRGWTAWLAARGDDAPTDEAAARATIPLGRPAAPSEIAAAVAWLASEESSYTTGAVLTLDGGATAQAFLKSWTG